MQLAETSIRRPVFATVLSLLIVLIGAVSFNRLSVREYPKIDEPVVSVQTRFRRRLDRGHRVAGHQGAGGLARRHRGRGRHHLDQPRRSAARSRCASRSAATPTRAAADVRDQVSRVRGRLPQGIDEPVIAKVEADRFPVIFLALSSETHSAAAADRPGQPLVKPLLQTVPGVADVHIDGERKLAMRIWLDPDRLAAYRLTVQDVEDALRRQNLEVPAGRIESRQREFNVTAAHRPATPGAVPPDRRCARSTATRCACATSARVQTAPPSERSSVRLNGRDSVAARRHPPGHRQSAGVVGRRARRAAARSSATCRRA